MKLTCPICDGAILITRVDDAVITYKLNSETGGLDEQSSKSDGYTSIECTENEDHEIPEDLQSYIFATTEI